MGRKGYERRRYGRYHLNGAIYAAIRPDFRRVGRVVDAGRGGLALEYATDLEALQREEVVVDVFCEQNNRMIRGVPCRVVYDVEESSSGSHRSLQSRRCGLQFLDPADSHLRLLTRLFLSHRVAQS